MTTNIFSVLNTAKVSLLAEQLAIEVTGQNIANVQTEGYTRQEVNFETTPPRQIGLGLLGTGVRVRSITRDFDQFLFRQILSEGDPTGNFSIRKDTFDQLENIFNETTGRSLNLELSRLFNSFQDLSTNPTGLPERTSVIAQAQSLVTVFNQTGEALFQKQLNLDAILQDEVAQINRTLEEIAKLNGTIHANEPGETPANDLRDRREILVKELSEKIDVTLVNENNGQFNLTLANGRPLVLGLTTFPLSLGINGDNKGFKDIFLSDGAGGTINVTNTIQGGRLRGILDMRDTDVEAIRNKFDRLTAGFIAEVNRVHRLGLGLDGSTGANFFNNLPATINPSTLNTGTPVVSVVNASPTTSSVDQYQIQFTGSTSFNLLNLSTGLGSGAFTFASGGTFNLANGLAVTITGGPAAGDLVDISISEGAATRITVNSLLISDPSKIAAGLSTVSDGNNAIDIAALQNQLVFDSTSLKSGSGSFTFDEFYSSIVSTIGIDSRTANSVVNQQEGVMLQLNNRRESISGVSIDEEMIQLIKFQQAYNASARLITVVNEMFDILQNRI